MRLKRSLLIDLLVHLLVAPFPCPQIFYITDLILLYCMWEWEGGHVEQYRDTLCVPRP
jgi:hypothetical protein